MTIPPDGRYVAETTLEILTTRDEVAAAEAEIADIQKRAVRVVHREPIAAVHEPLDELGRVGASSADDRHLHTHGRGIVHSARWNR